MKHIKVSNEKALHASIGEFSTKYNLKWIVDGRCVGAILEELEEEINLHDDVDAEIEPQAFAKFPNGHVLKLGLSDLKGVEVVEEKEVPTHEGMTNLANLINGGA